MALTPPLGSSTTTLPRNDLPDNIPNSQSDLLPSMPFISDGNLNKTAIDVSQYPNTTKALSGFGKGKRILVTYYRLRNREGVNNRSNIADQTSARNIIHTEYQKIKNLEITLPKEFDFSANNAQANASITGSAWFYPNMNPNIGDMFLMGVGDGRVGVCRISSVTPLSWRDSRSYVVNFIVQEFANYNNHHPLDDAVTQVSVFDKANYLGGTGALLSEETYFNLLKIKQVRSNLCRHFHQMFYDENICSFVRPDGAYDPWATQFMTNKITMDDVGVRAKNLFGNRPDLYRMTLWGRLEDRYNTSLLFLNSRSYLTSYRQTRMGVFLTELINYQVLFTDDDQDKGEPYLFSFNFYSANIEEMTAEELLFFNVVTKRVSGDLNVLIAEYLDTILTKSLLEQFYKIPLYIHLIDIAQQTQYREIDAPSMNYASPRDSE